MDDPTAPAAPPSDAPPAPSGQEQPAGEDTLVEADLLVEDVSIDGMCGVYQMDAQFDLARPWALDPQVALRPEPFGALAYHFGTRRLSFLKSAKLATVVRALGEQPTGRDACVAAGVGEDELPAYERALAALATSGMIAERPAA